MRQIFEAELRQIGDDLVEMAQLVEQAVAGAGKALLEADLQTAQQVIAGDHEIDALHRALDERCVHILAQQAPVATDLRVVVSALRMSATLERMGDLARHVAEVARGRYPAHAIRATAQPTFAGMAEAAAEVAREVTVLLSTRDLELAGEIEKNDDVLDNLHAQTFATILGPEWDGTTQEAVDITLVGRYLERFGDHATSIARRIVFLVTGDVDEGPTHD
ncbi:phosphate uptake regulator, PhoU [Xylanimonas cellulosilytica DSM 15894]|uniref:Phosphate-specific transport system accessory protein PhoU n=1 Tax=Xylanimonas cellulosilytica (strain DSM 15894 / JCM 12276 / CECT 5975 / KCTC 9989 / LMG 20990 / NBRC 107835 / XIL07) TaxID=446471 RepID=D1BZ80_XYLCX|nr:phosphate signaling complex protein PhoU [Xylanimonas cellulosilytica]ACZ31977.1 phosphate uptake regulator, PhoU [Xylanimonas cellulosilytica DSM 15894]